MKKHEKSATLTRNATPSRSTALIAVERPAPRRGVIASAVRLVAAVVLLPVRLPVLALAAAARGVARVGAAAGRGLGAVGGGLLRVPVLLARLVAMPFVGLARGLAWVAPRLGRGVGALLMLPVRLVVLLARLVAMPFVGLARGAAWVAPRLGRGVAAVVMLPVRLVVGIARLVGMLVRGLARLVALLFRGIALSLMFILRIPFVALRLLGRGSVGAARGIAVGVAAVLVPAAALAWGLVRAVAAGIAAVARGFAVAVAFAGRLAGRGVAALLLGILATSRSMAIGIFVCVRAVVLALLWIAILPFRALRIVAVATARGIRGLALLFAGAVRTVAAGLVALLAGAVALVRLAGRGIGRAARSVGGVVLTREPQRAAFLPLATLAALGGVEMFTPGFPFATVGLLLLAAFAALALMSRPVTMGGVLLAWGLAVVCGWRAERVALDSPVWFDALVYLASLAALRSAYVAVRAFATEGALAPRAPEQERAHRRASRAIGLALIAQCLAFFLWSLGSGVGAGVVIAELLLVGGGAALAWVVRSGQYVRTAQVVLTAGALGAVVLMIAAQLTAFAAGQAFTAASVGAGLLLALVAAALVVVVHTRQIDSDHGM